MSDDEIQIILPAKDNGALEWMLEGITRALADRNPDSISHGFLGGEFGYGGYVDNSVFTMRPFYWGDCDCGWAELEATYEPTPHRETCYQIEYQALGNWIHLEGAARKKYDKDLKALLKKYGLSKYGCAIHCTCDHEPNWIAWYNSHKLGKDNGHADTCSLVLPNFHHKASGLIIRWYKYIGRDMEVEGSGDYQAIFNECVKSLNN